MSQLHHAKPASLRRRDFLALSSMAAGAALLPRFAAAAESQGRAEKLSVGYLVDSDRLDDVFTLPWSSAAPGAQRDEPREEQREEQWVVPAESLPTGDSTMAFSFIKLKVHGLYPALPPAQPGPGATVIFTVEFHMPWLGISEPLPFHAWGARFGSQPTSGSPVRFVAPTREDGSLAVSFDILPPVRKGATPRRAAADFTVDHWTGRPKLQRGIYLLGIGGDTFSRELALPSHPEAEPWQLVSLALSVDHLEEGDI